MEWDDAMDRLETVAILAREGKLGDSQQAEYERLLKRLSAYLPLTEQLGVPVPRRLLAAMPATSPKPA